MLRRSSEAIGKKATRRVNTSIFSREIQAVLVSGCDISGMKTFRRFFTDETGAA